MKNIRQILLLVMLTLSVGAFAGKTKAFADPVCLGTNNRHIKITRVEFTDTATVVSFHVHHRPGWMMSLKGESHLLGEKGRKYMAIGGEGFKLDGINELSDSTETEFKLLFEPMPKKTRCLDFIGYGGNSPYMIVGVHDKAKPIKIKTPDDFVMTEELEKEFFKADTVCVRGRIEQYSQLGKNKFKTMSFIQCNTMTDEDAPMAVKVNEDGTFEFRYMAYHPKKEVMLMSRGGVSYPVFFYAVPGQTTELSVPLFDPAKYVKKPEGPFALNNSMVYDFDDICYYSYDEHSDDSEGVTATGDFAEKVMDKMADRLRVADYISGRFGYTPWERHLARLNTMISFGYRIFDFDMLARHAVGELHLPLEEWKVAMEPFDNPQTYAFMRLMPCNDPATLMFDNTATLLNRYEFSHIMQEGYKKIADDKGFISMESDTAIAMTDKRILGASKPSFFGEMMVLRDINRVLTDNASMGEDTLKAMFDARRKHLSHYALLEQADILFKQAVVKSKVITPMPFSASANAFQKILDKYKGKYVMVDFWGMHCPPCRAEIQETVEMRKALRDNPDIEFVFISIANETSEEAYQEYVGKYLDGEEVYAASHDDFNHFMELFKFTGIPHYESFDRQGNIINQGFQYTYTAEDFIRNYLNPIKEKLDK